MRTHVVLGSRYQVFVDIILVAVELALGKFYVRLRLVARRPGLQNLALLRLHSSDLRAAKLNVSRILRGQDATTLACRGI